MPATPDEESFGDVIDTVDALDLSAFDEAYRADGSGGQPYDPRLMVVAILWCIRQGWRSPSEMARMCRRTVVLRDWFGGRVPGLSTFRRFLLVHARAWRRLFPDVLGLCDQVGLLDPSITATDGTVMGSPGSLRGLVPLWRIRSEIDDIETELEELARANAELAETLADPDDLVVERFVDVACDQARREETRLRRRLGALVVADRVGSELAATVGAAGRSDPECASARLARQEETLAVMVAEREAKCAAYARTVEACSHGAGRPPLPVERYTPIIRQREAIERTKKN